jgi:hypothetical protein
LARMPEGLSFFCSTPRIKSNRIKSSSSVSNLFEIRVYPRLTNFFFGAVSLSKEDEKCEAEEENEAKEENGALIATVGTMAPCGDGAATANHHGQRE